MNILELFIFVLIAVILLIINSYFKKGFRITLSFFLFSFIAGMRKEVGGFLGPIISDMPGPTPFEHTSLFPLNLCILNTVMGWIIAFYLSWYIGERITNRFKYLKNKIFTTILFSGIVIAAFAYAIEATAINIGWWKWEFFDKSFADLFVAGVHIFAIKAWFYFLINFFLAYFLIECSRFKNISWKCIFFLIPLSRTWTILFLGSGPPRIIHEYLILAVLIVVAFFKPLSFKYPEFKTKISVPYFLYKIVDSIPLIVSYSMLSVLLYIDIVKLRNVAVIISLLPIISLLIIAVSKVSIWLVTLICLTSFLFMGKIIIPALFMPFILLLVQLFSYFKDYSNKKLIFNQSQ